MGSGRDYGPHPGAARAVFAAAVVRRQVCRGAVAQGPRLVQLLDPRQAGVDGPEPAPERRRRRPHGRGDAPPVGRAARVQ